MIFVCVGSRNYQFNRLLMAIDRSIEAGEITQPVFAQIGGSTYEPQHFNWERFLDKNRFDELQDEASLIVSHGGTGALIGALKKGKRVVVAPRLAKYGEHTDDHQLQISGVLASEGYVHEVLDLNELGIVIQRALQGAPPRVWQKPSKVLSLVEAFLAELVEEKDRSR